MSWESRCAVATYCGVWVPVASSNDWAVRVTQGGGFKVHCGSRWGAKLRERAGDLDGPPELRLMGCHADFLYARSVQELHCAQAFLRRSAVTT